jgi:hypothetical protein
MDMMKQLIFLLMFFAVKQADSQTLGGNAIFNFLTQPNTAQLAALGNVNVSSISNDVGMAFSNPALLRDSMHQQISSSFYSFAEGVKQYGLQTAFHLSKIRSNIGVGVQYLDYGTLTQTDASGNVLGNFRPSDYVVQLMFSKSYKEKWWVGFNTKFINSNYGLYRSNGMAVDAAIAYFDHENKLQVSVVAKNMGTQLRTYNASGTKEELPFDLQVGITKRLLKAPLQFSLTAHHLHRFDIFYNDTLYNAQEGDARYVSSNGFQKLMAHLVFSTDIFLSNQFQITAALNLMRRQSLNAYNITNGLNGFSLGFGVLLNKLQIRYATGFYQQNLFHQLSLNFNVKGNPL